LLLLSPYINSIKVVDDDEDFHLLSVYQYVRVFTFLRNRPELAELYVFFKSDFVRQLGAGIPKVTRPLSMPEGNAV
jgi:hypothetical protein